MIPCIKRLAIVPAVLAVLALLAASGSGGVTAASPLTDLTLPPGFELRVFASNVDVARFLTYSPAGDLYVGQLLGHQGALTILPDRNHDGVADRAIQIGTDLYSPNNVTFRPIGFGTVFAVGAMDRVKVYTDTNGDLSFAQSAVLVDNLPSDGRHRTKTVAYGPDGLLYVSVGSFDDDPPGADARAGIWRYNADGSGQHKLAGGLRNTVGFAWDPVGGGMWGADNGSDDLGRDEPHDELNLLVDGGNYGWPNCIDQGVHNDKTNPVDCSKTLAPTTLFDPHGAPLGIAFYSGASFPQQYWGGLFAADHSIQYTEQRGVYFVPFKNGSPSGPPQLFLQQSQSSGTTNRFLGLAVNPYDGSLMVSDDREGRIYQVRYTGRAAHPDPRAAPHRCAGQAPAGDRRASARLRPLLRPDQPPPQRRVLAVLVLERRPGPLWLSHQRAAARARHGRQDVAGAVHRARPAGIPPRESRLALRGAAGTARSRRRRRAHRRAVPAGPRTGGRRVRYRDQAQPERPASPPTGSATAECRCLATR